MRTVILGIETQSDVTRRVLATARGRRKAGDGRISFENISELWRVLAPKRMEIVRAMTGTGPLTIREVAPRRSRFQGSSFGRDDARQRGDFGPDKKGRRGISL